MTACAHSHFKLKAFKPLGAVPDCLLLLLLLLVSLHAANTPPTMCPGHSSKTALMAGK